MCSMWRILTFFIIFVSSILVNVNSENVLFLGAVASPSHFIWNRALAYGIAAKGHNVTMVSPDVEKSKSLNLHFIHLENIYSTIYNGSDGFDLMEMANEKLIGGVLGYYDFCIKSCKGLLSSKGFDILLNYPNDFKFDLIVYDFTVGPCDLYFLHKFNYPPLISITAFNNPPYTHQVIGGHKFPAYIPYYALSYSTNMNFFQRTLNTMVYIFDNLYLEYMVLPKIETMVRNRITNDFPPLKKMQQNALLLLVNSHPALDYPESVPPNVIQVAGLQIVSTKPLPKDIEDFIEAGSKGAVLFSLGTNVRSDMLTPETQSKFIEAFQRIPEYNFIWKFESDASEKLPRNVLIKPWLPQNDILAHPKIKAFISHSGLLSTQEATWHAVPIIAVPFFADQHRNSFSIVDAGVGEKIIIQTITVDDITNTVKKVLETPSYSEKMKIRSETFRDQPMKPLDTAIWWVEWALRNPKATHLRPPTLELGFIATNGYDIILAVVIVVSLLVYFVRRFISRIFNTKMVIKQTVNDKKLK